MKCIFFKINIYIYRALANEKTIKILIEKEFFISMCAFGAPRHWHGIYPVTFCMQKTKKYC